MLGDLSKLADKAFIIGFYLPALLATLALSWVLRDVALFRLILDSALQPEKLEKLFIVVLLVWFAAVVLLVCNRFMTRTLEGYHCPSWIASALRERALKRRGSALNQLKEVQTNFEDLDRSANELKAAGNAPDKAATLRKQSEDARRSYFELLRKYQLRNPPNRSDTLPTRFGNIFRSFEAYPTEAYGVESIHTWPRLMPLISADQRTALENTKSFVDFFVCGTFLTIALGVIALAQWVRFIVHDEALPQETYLLFVAAGSFLLSIFAYKGALSAALEYGEVVKSTFDLYLPALAKQLGFDWKNPVQARPFWNYVDRQIRFQEAIPSEFWEAKKPRIAFPLPSRKDAKP